jgi:hypothetical protein
MRTAPLDTHHSVAKIRAGSSSPANAKIANGAFLVPVIPGEPSGMPGNESPLIAGF